MHRSPPADGLLQPSELRCRACGYSLVGLPWGDGGEIDCPECGSRDFPTHEPEHPWPEFWLFAIVIGGPPALGTIGIPFLGVPTLAAGWAISLLALCLLLACCEDFKDGTPRPSLPKLLAFFLTLNIAAPVLTLLIAAVVAIGFHL